MYNLYQSQLRKDIQHEIYRKPTFTVEIFGKEYFGTIKTKKIGPFTTKRYQVMGVELPSDQEYVRSEIARLRKHFRKKGIFLQLGFINEIISFENCDNKCEEFREDMKEMRLSLQDYLDMTYGLKTAFRENMPNSDIIVDLTKTDEELMAEMNASARQRIRKAMKNDVEFCIATPDQYKSFYDKRLKTSGHKGFNIISYDQFERLITHIVKTGRGNIFIAGMGQEIYSGNICLYDGKYIIYIYGFTDREYSKTGSHHYLLYRMFGRARENSYLHYDFMGGAPTGFPNHPLTSVSEFKESLGGTKIDQYGSYDIVLNKFLYRAFKLRYKIRG